MQRRKNDAPHLILLTRWPEPGRVKTRLIPALGAEETARLHRWMSETAFATLCRCRATCGATVEIRHCGGAETAMRQWLMGADQYNAQGDGNLGARLCRAFADAFARNRRPVVAIGADCPALTESHLAAALAGLADHDLVLGPATDGGYYCLALKAHQPGLFTAIPWGSANVLQETLARATALHLDHLLLETLPDVDRPEDLIHLGHHPGPR